MPRLSLIVATYNRAEQLLTTLWSVAAQTAPAAEWECVVVDNNSTDDTAARFEEFLSAHPGLPLRRVSETRQGLSWARNRGIAETTGDIVAIIDDDERIVPEFIAAYIAFFDAHPSVASAGGPIVDPRLDAFTACPVCPHAFAAARALVFSPESVLTATVTAAEAGDIQLSCDGRAVAALQSGNCLTVRRAALRTRLIRIKKDAFYQTLYRKFNAGRSI